MFAVAPLRPDIVENERAPQAGDGPSLEPVPGCRTGNEDERAVAAERRAFAEALVRPVNICSEIRLRLAVSKSNQAGKLLFAKVGVRLEPKAVAIEGIFEPQMGAIKVCAAKRRDFGGDLSRLQSLGEAGERRKRRISGASI